MRLIGAVALLAVLSAGQTSGQQRAITVDQAKSLVRLVLQHEHLHYQPKYCDIRPAEKDGTPFVPNYYSLAATCDFPNTVATDPLGIFVVSPRTGDVWEFNSCDRYTFPELLKLREKIAGSSDVAEKAEAEYRRDLIRDLDCTSAHPEHIIDK